MNYFSQTGQPNMGKQQQTSPTDNNSNVVIRVQEVIFKTLDQARIFQKNNEDERCKEELTKEEEDKFYKKVFKTSLI